MRTWTNILPLAAPAVLFTLTVAGCAEAGPGGMTEADTITPGDPAVYAPDGWPLKVGDRVSHGTMEELRKQFRLPGLPRSWEESVRTRHPSWGTSGPPFRSAWDSYYAMNLVGGRVYAARIEYDPTKVGDYDHVYRGHFPIRFDEDMREQEPDLPPEFHGRVEYFAAQPVPPYTPPHLRGPIKTTVIDMDMWDADGRLLKLDPDYVPQHPDPREWPDYPERRK